MTLRRTTAVVAIVVVLAVTFFLLIYRPWSLTWGATPEEVNRRMIGDELVSNAKFNATRAVTINARPAEIWPWIVQIGYRKAGFYSYDRLDNDGIPSTERIIPEYQNLRVGDAIPLSSTIDAKVQVMEPNRLLLLAVYGDSSAHEPWTWAWGLYPQDEERTRLITRLRMQPEGTLENLVVDAFEIVMMRKCMLGIKRRVEAASSETSDQKREAANPQTSHIVPKTPSP